MKRFFCALVLMTMVIVMTGCSKSPNIETSDPTGESSVESYTEEDFPAAKEEEQEIINRYLAPYSVTGLTWVEFSEEDKNKLDGDLLMPMFDALSHTLGSPTEEEKSKYGEVLPEEMVEKVLTSHFKLTAEEVRKACEGIYDPDKKVYLYQGGLGGGPAAYIITKHAKDGNILSFSYKFFTGDLGEDDEFILVFAHEGEMRIKVSKKTEDFVFLSNKAY